MTKSELYTLTTSLNGGYEIDNALFESFLDIAQMRIEGLRPWVILRTEDSSESVGSGDTYLTPKTIPSGFLNWGDDNFPIVILDSNNNPTYLREIPMSRKLEYKDSEGVFYCDYSTNKLYLTGKAVGTIYKYYCKESPLVSGSLDWAFPSRFHKILAFYVSVMWKLGIDYDVISNSQGNSNAGIALSILDIMTMWDTKLQESMTRGTDPFVGGGLATSWQSGKMPL